MEKQKNTNACTADGELDLKLNLEERIKND